LPFLASLRGREAHAFPDPSKKRFVAFFQANGIDISRFWPSVPYGQLTAESLSGSALEPLAGFSDRLLIPRGVHMVPFGDGLIGNLHQRGVGAVLTAQPLLHTSKYAAGISVDQRMAEQLHGDASPPLTLFVGQTSGSVLSHISYRGSDQPVAAENNPWLVYQDLMGLASLGEEARQRLLERRESVLDLVSEEYQTLMDADLCQADRDKLDMHFSAIRDLENGMDDEGVVPCLLDPARAAEVEALDPETVAYDANFKKIGLMQMDILALALACGRTQVATIQWGPGSGGPIYSWDGMDHDYDHHVISHGNTKEDESGEPLVGYADMLHEIDRWYATQFAYLLEKLDAYPEADGSVLDNSALVWTNELSEGRLHDYRDIPYVMAGSAGGYFSTGRYVKLTAQDDPVNDVDAPHNRLLTSLLNAVGVTDDGAPVEHFGAEGVGGLGEYEQLKA
jgi:hypothetical protein